MLNNVETEAKFIIPDLTAFDALQQITHLDDFEITPIGIKNIIDRYLDTPDKHLLQAGFVCRIRNAKDQQILTLKSSLKATTGEIHRRQELEMEVNNDQPLAWAESEVKDLVLGIVGQTPLQTLFTLYQTRHKFHVSYQEKLIIELSLDKVYLHQPTSIDYLGLEAELIEAGTEADLTRFIETLQRVWPLEADLKSKFEHALTSLGPDTFT